MTPESGGNFTMVFVLSFLAYFVISACLAFLGAGGSLKDGLELGLVTGVGFAFTSIAVTQMYEQKPFKLTLINAGYNIVGFIIASIIVTRFG